MQINTTIEGTRLPLQAVVNRILREIKVGDAATIPAEHYPEVLVRRTVDRVTRTANTIYTVRAEGDQTIIERFPKPVRKVGEQSVRVQLIAMEPGQTILIEDAAVGTVRVVAATIKQYTGRRFTVHLVTNRITRVRELHPGENSGRQRYPLDTIDFMGSMHIAKGDHSGKLAMQSLARQKAKKLACQFDVHENIDGSLTVRRYAIGARPSKWAVDAAHQRVQDAIIAAGFKPEEPATVEAEDWC
jgi:hypothetical protein